MHPFADELPPGIAAAIDNHMLTVDPPDHTRLRRLVSAAFTRRRTDALGSLIARFPRLRLAVPAAEITRTPGFMRNGLAALPVRPR